MSLEGKVTLITGAGSGLGRAMVDQFVAQGARVIAVDIREDRLARVAEETGVSTVHGDVADPEAVERAVAGAGAPIDILCNNAGIIDRLGAIDEVAREEWDLILSTNVTGTFLFCRRVIPDMLQRGGGVIVNTASVAGLRGARAGVAYTASKFALVGLTQNIAATHGERGIRCNAICPGSMATNIGEGLTPFPGGMTKVTRDQAVPAPGDPAHVAAVAVFLASDGAAFVNGAAIPVDEGWITY